MKKINIIIVVFLLLACKEQKNDKKIIKCPNTTVVTHDNFNVRFCLPEYLKSVWVDTVFTGYEPGMRIDYNYSMLDNPIIGNSDWATQMKYEDSLFINFKVIIDKDDYYRDQLPQKEKYLPFLIGKRRFSDNVEIIDSAYTETNEFYIYDVEWSPKSSTYICEKVFFMKDGNYLFGLEYKVMNNKKEILKKYQSDAKKLMQSVEIKK